MHTAAYRSGYDARLDDRVRLIFAPDWETYPDWLAGWDAADRDLRGDLPERDE